MSKMKSTLLDNSPKFRLVEKIREIIHEDDVNQLLIATGYWDIPGTALLAKELDDFLKQEGKSVRLLIGKDPTVFSSQLAELKREDIKATKDLITIELAALNPKSEYAEAVRLLKTYCDGENPKFLIRTFENPDDERQFFHSKCWLFLAEAFSETEKGNGIYAIIGSSNFTEKGLRGNSELNFFEADDFILNALSENPPYSKGYLEWFREKWELSKDWTKEFLLALNNSPVGKLPAPNQNEVADFALLSPKDAWRKLLITQFASYLDSAGKIAPSEYVPRDPKFKSLSYQLQAVNQAFGILEKHHGMILADVVGLGKTFTALMIVKRSLLESDFAKPVLIITPPAVKKSWQDSIDYFDKDAEKKIGSYITLTTIGCLDSEGGAENDEDLAQTDDFDSAFVKKAYGMVVVDESHRFRNSGTIMYQKLEDLLAETKPFVVLLSATPQNNRPSDIANQLYLFEHDRRHSTLTALGQHESNLESYFSEKEKVYEACIRDWSEKDGEGNKIPKTKAQKKQDMLTLKELADQIRDDVLNQLVIRRTRTDLQSDLYKADMEKQGIVFPKIQPPEGLPYEMTGSLAQLFVHTLDVIAPKVSRVDVDENGMQELDFREEGVNCLGYYRYRAIQYLKDAKNRKRYEYDSKRGREASGTITAEGISERLAGLMELHLVKRLESSRDAFEESLKNLYANTQNMLRMLESDCVFVCPDFDIHKILNAYSVSEREKAFAEIRAKIATYNKKHQTDRNAEYRAKDFTDEYVQNLQNDLALIGSLVDEWAKNKQDKKRDTFVMNIESKFLNKKRNPSQKIVVFTECIATQNMLYEFLNGNYPGQVLKITAKNRTDMQEVLEANFDANYKGTPQDTYKILVTTDVLAEGVNLHRANTLINYDSPWNSTRLMQRLGRINRIGSTSEKIYSYNFYPSTLGDSQINLYKRTLIKLQAFHNMFGEDSQIYTQDEELVEIERPDFAEAESLDPKIEFITELRDFKEKEPAKYADLLAIKKPVVTAVAQNNGGQNHSGMYSLVQNGFFCVDEAHPAGFYAPNQIAFCRTIRELAKNEMRELSVSEYKDCQQKCLVAFQTQRSNEGLSVKSKTRVNEKDRLSAMKKLDELKKQYTLSAEVFPLFNDIKASVRGNNAPLIRKILDADCDGLLEIDSLLQDWHAMLAKKVNGAMPEVRFMLVAKKDGDFLQNRTVANFATVQMEKHFLESIDKLESIGEQK